MATGAVARRLGPEKKRFLSVYTGLPFTVSSSTATLSVDTLLTFAHRPAGIFFPFSFWGRFVGIRILSI